MPASYEELLDQFFNDYSHHFTPSGEPHKVDPRAYLEAERLRRGITKDAPSDKGVRDTINALRQQRGLPPLDGTPTEIGASRLTPDHQAVYDALKSMAGTSYREADAISTQPDRRGGDRIKSGLTPWADRIAAKYGPQAGQMADSVGNVVDVVGHGAQELTGVPQFLRAGESLANAVSDPSIGSITNAGAQTALSVLKPTAAAKILAGGYAAAGVKDAATTLLGGANAADGLNDSQDKRLKQIEAAIRNQSYSSGAERRQMEAEASGLRRIREQYFADQAELTKQRAAAQNEQDARAAQAKQDEYNRAVRVAEAARDRELGRRTSFDTSSVKDVFDKTGGVPGLALSFGVGAGVLDRMAKGPIKTWSDTGRVAAEGTGAAMVPNNWVLGYNAFGTPTDNPEKAAYQAYARELPDGHPLKARAQAFADSLSDANPVRVEAQKELYDIPKIAERVGMSALEGVPSALTGHNIPGALKNAGEGIGGVVPTIGVGWQKEMERYNASKAKSDRVRQVGDQRQQVGDQRQQYIDEALRRSGGQGGTSGQGSAGSSQGQPPQPVSSQSPSPASNAETDITPASGQQSGNAFGLDDRTHALGRDLVEAIKRLEAQPAKPTPPKTSADDLAKPDRFERGKFKKKDTLNSIGIAGGLYGANAFGEPDDPSQTIEFDHHSSYQPRRSDGTFKGPPSKDWYE